MVEHRDEKTTGETPGTKALSVHLDSNRLSIFLHEYYDLDLPHGSVSSIISHAFMALIGAGVIVSEDSTPVTDTSIWMNGGRVWADVNRSSESGDEKLVWINTDATFDPSIRLLFDALVSVLNSPPHEGPLGRPHTRN